jgi:NADH-quinone oxidoreductase subunit N
MLSHTLDNLRTFLHSDGALLLPELELLLFAMGILLMDAWVSQREKYWSSGLALAGMAFSGSTLWMLRGRIAQNGDLIGLHDTMVADPYFIFFSALFVAGVAMVTLLSMNQPMQEGMRAGRYYALLMIACACMMFLISGVDLVVSFVALEALSITSYFLVAAPGFGERPSGAAVNFILTSAVGSALVAFGFSLVYGLSDATNIGGIGSALSRRHQVAQAIALSQRNDARGAQIHQMLQERLPEALNLHPWAVQALPVVAVGLVLFGLYLKFYGTALRRPGADRESIPEALGLYAAGPMVAALLAFLLRFLVTVFGDVQHTWLWFVAIAAFALLICGTWSALRENSPVRAVQAAAIAQIGNVLLGLVAANEGAFTGFTYYLFGYLFVLAGTFAVLAIARRKNSPDSASEYELDGLRQKNPMSAALLILFLLGLAGFPPTAGLYGRYLLFHALVETGHRYVAWAAAAIAVPLAYVYLRIAVRAWRTVPDASRRDDSGVVVTFGAPEAIVLGVSVFVCVAAELYSEPFARMARYAFGK